ncbi:Neutral ceramidase [Zootermopsis nevadensis]|uniref:Neutral ceramidase n=1 Tax=Zootermopsis nevadensis TaxID=136037 RepID=A0A067RJZ6_ZOONE|nr:Neutral ceramidase [Zootermopsis nevadensis]
MFSSGLSKELQTGRGTMDPLRSPPVLLTVSVFLLSVVPQGVTAGYKIGVGIADVTGPSAEIGFMGYAKMRQKGTGIHLRQFSRAFIFNDGKHRLVFVSVDCAMIANGLRKEVLARLKTAYGDLYTEQNVMLSGSHTHSTPGGYMQNLLFDLSILGFVRQTFAVLTSGIVKSVRKAHESMTRGSVFVTQGEVQGANINRSPTAYLANPPAERAKYRHDVDKTMVQLRLVRDDGTPLGAINWFAVHPTSMNNTNTLVSSDNVGYAAILFEQRMNPGRIIGKGPFVSAFASSNLGDVSPNVRGARCQFSGRPCDLHSSSCSGRKEMCIASGPGADMFESTRTIAIKLFSKAWELWNDKDSQEVTGPLGAIHQFVDMPSQQAKYFDHVTRKSVSVRGCLPAMGYSFAAGTTDGPGSFSFQQGMKTENPLWNAVRNFLASPSAADVACHGAKPVLLATGNMDFPFEWQPRIVSTQLALIGPVAIACVPGEFTTMSGRRLRGAVSEGVAEGGGQRPSYIIVAGLCNTYSDYITTPEEYEVQRYEGASTIYGPHTLTIYLSQYRKLAAALIKGSQLNRGPNPPDLWDDLVSFVTPVVFDTPKWSHNFGDCTEQPVDVAEPGVTVRAKFVAAHPRNNLTLGGTYLTVERFVGSSGQWVVVATDANWETRFYWIRLSPILGSSEALITWTVDPEVVPGKYRIRHFGSYKYIFGGIHPYHGSTHTFQVVNKGSDYKRLRH